MYLFSKDQYHKKRYDFLFTLTMSFFSYSFLTDEISIYVKIKINVSLTPL